MRESLQSSEMKLLENPARDSAMESFLFVERQA